MIAINKLETLNQREDLYQKFEYNHDRVLDALARILNVETCAAITHSKEKSQFIISFNSTLIHNQAVDLNKALMVINKVLQNKDIYDIVYTDKGLSQQIKLFENTILGKNKMSSESLVRINKSAVSFKKNLKMLIIILGGDIIEANVYV